MKRKMSDAGLALLKGHEKCRLKAYKPTKNDVWTIGWGSTRGVLEGMEITLEEAEERLRKDVIWAEQCVNTDVTVPLTQNQFDALVSFVFNVGGHAFRTSKMLRLLNAEDYEGAAAQFDRWKFQKGEVLGGLVARRNAEEGLFRA